MKKLLACSSFLLLLLFSFSSAMAFGPFTRSTVGQAPLLKAGTCPVGVSHHLKPCPRGNLVLKKAYNPSLRCNQVHYFCSPIGIR